MTATTTALAESNTFEVGQFVQELLWTDTRVWEVVKVTAQTITVRPTQDVTGGHRNVYHDGNPYPVTYNLQEPSPLCETRVVRRRKDGTFRITNSSNRLWACPSRERRTDYRF